MPSDHSTVATPNAWNSQYPPPSDPPSPRDLRQIQRLILFPFSFISSPSPSPFSPHRTQNRNQIFFFFFFFFSNSFSHNPNGFKKLPRSSSSARFGSLFRYGRASSFTPQVPGPCTFSSRCGSSVGSAVFDFRDSCWGACSGSKRRWSCFWINGC